MLISNLIANFWCAIRSAQRTKLANDQLSNFAYDDEQLFKVLCQFVWVQGDPLPLIFDVRDEVYKREGLTLSGLERLAALGLIEFDAQGFVKKGFGKHTRLFYCGKPTKIGFPSDENNSLDLGHVIFTERGKQFFLAITVFRNQQFYEYVIQRWFQSGVSLSSIQIDRK